MLERYEKKMNSKDDERRAVLVGDYVGTIEEFIPSKGTFIEDGKIYAANTGMLDVDEDMGVRVSGDMPMDLKVGQIVFGEVIAMSDKIITVIIKKMRGIKGRIDVKSGIHVSNISDRYLEKPADGCAIGDILEGKVIRMEHGLIDLTTKGSLGVVKAFCKRCRTPLNLSKKQDVLICPKCGSEESRKVADDYGAVSVV